MGDARLVVDAFGFFATATSVKRVAWVSVATRVRVLGSGAGVLNSNPVSTLK